MSTVHNALRGVSSLLTAIRAAVGGDAEVQVERLSETIYPQLDPWGMPEWAFLRREILAARRVNAAALAGEFSFAAFVNPAGSGALCVVEELTAAAAAAFVFEVDAATEAAVTATGTLNAAGLARDRRANRGATFATTLQTYTGTDAASFIGQAYERIASSGANLTARAVCAVPLILPPGDGVVVIGQTVNTAITVCAKWRERRAFTGELV